MTQTAAPAPRVAHRPTGRAPRGLSQRVLARPELGAILAAIVIYVFFWIVAPPFRSAAAFGTILYASSQIGIVAVAVGLLMIGGEFDLSAGVMYITAGLSA